MRDFYIIYIRPRDDVPVYKVEARMNKAIDWFRFDQSVWIVYTSSDSARWYSRLAPFVLSSGSLFICRLDISKRHGRFNKELWTWLDSKDSPKRKPI